MKLVKPGEGGVLAAILPAGMRAISTRIKEETGVGRLILPNDHVDVILTQRRRGRAGGDEFVSDTLFRNVRVLAIGQLIEAQGRQEARRGQHRHARAHPRRPRELALANADGRDLAGAAQHRRHRQQGRAARPSGQAGQFDQGSQVRREVAAYGVVN